MAFRRHYSLDVDDQDLATDQDGRGGKARKRLTENELRMNAAVAAVGEKGPRASP
jgi:hypothetical protein